MYTRPFLGHEHMLEVECTGNVLDSKTNLQTIVLYSVADNKVLATADLKHKECLTYGGYASCVMNPYDALKTRLRVLVLDLQFEEIRVFGWMSVEAFQGHETIQEVTCSGEGLHPTSHLLSMTMFRLWDDEVLSVVNFATRECSSSETFSMCWIKDDRDYLSKEIYRIQILQPGSESVSVLLSSAHFCKQRPKNGLTRRPFRNISSVQEIECTGDGLSSDADVFAMTLFAVEDGQILASVNLKSSQCSTSHSYSACVINHNNSRKSRLITLAVDAEETDRKTYGCNVSSFRSGLVQSLSWSIPVEIDRYLVACCAARDESSLCLRLFHGRQKGDAAGGVLICLR
ncbi:hypothetical protein BaRGS_00019876, partial [Batillaria attramentaria]